MPTRIAPLSEAEAFLAAHPEVSEIDLMFTTMSGVPRGKRIRRHELAAVYKSGRFLPHSIAVCDITGQDCDATGLIWDDGDADRVAKPQSGTLVKSPWQGDNSAQVILSLYELDGRPSELDPRHVLSGVIDRMAADGLTPVVACELEFYLLQAGGGDVAAGQGGYRPSHCEVYGLTELEAFAPLIDGIWAAGDVQGLPIEAAISEHAPGQLEIGLTHRADALQAADEAIMFKRLVKGVATALGHEATFMAKPFVDRAGSGMHLHVSVNDASGNNVFASEAPEGSDLQRWAIGGMKALLPSSMAIFAPNANSYRRFKANSYAPVSPTWGINNRTVSLRVPAGAAHTRHVEHRVSGADANPYLAVAALLAAVHHGIKNRIDPGPMVTGNGYAHAEETGQKLPTNWFAAVDQFAADPVLADYFGARFQRLFSIVKRQEQERFFEVVTAQDYEWYMRNA
jgi:glutamine synthetase